MLLLLLLLNNLDRDLCRSEVPGLLHLDEMLLLLEGHLLHLLRGGLELGVLLVLLVCGRLLLLLEEHIVHNLVHLLLVEHLVAGVAVAVVIG